MFVSDPRILTPDDNSIIYRYRPLKFFNSILEKRSLAFVSVKSFQDSWEGELPLKAWKKQQRAYLKEGTGIIDLSHLSEYIQCNCWSLNPKESILLWIAQGYSYENEPIVALKSTIGLLKQSLEKIQSPIYIGKIKYIDYETDSFSFINNENTSNAPDENTSNTPDILQRHLIKRSYFEDEREVRVFNINPNIFRANDNPTYTDSKKMLFIEVSLEKLIDEIIISPYCDKSNEDNIKALVEKSGLDPNIVRRSTILDKPEISRKK